MENDILTGNVLVQLALQLEFQSGRHLEPSLADGHAACHVGRADTGRECAQSTVGAGVGVRTDHSITGDNESFFRQKCMLNAHLSNVVEMRNILLAAEITAHHALLCSLDVLVRSKVIHYHGHLLLVKNALLAHLVECLDGNRRGNIIAKHEIQIHQHELSSLDLVETGVCSEDLLCHGHTHVLQSFRVLKIISDDIPKYRMQNDHKNWKAQTNEKCQSNFSQIRFPAQ